jgi:hypothetical protein
MPYLALHSRVGTSGFDPGPWRIVGALAALGGAYDEYCTQVPRWIPRW